LNWSCLKKLTGIYNLKRIDAGINPVCDFVLFGLGEAGYKIYLRMDGLVSGS
jgi:hypothetical protein